jgi:FkbM family methyltransferase
MTIIKHLKQLTRKTLHRLGFYISRTDSINYLELILYGYLEHKEEVFFIQIGANDGVSTDPIYNFVTLNNDRVTGIAIEPMKDIYEQLKHNYKGYSNVIFENIAIHNSKSEMSLYRVDPKNSEKLPKWTKGIASFNKWHHELSGIDFKFIISEKVKCISFDGLLNKYNINQVDLLQIDTEGYDSEIIFSIDFSKIKPSIIHFEHGLRDGVMDKNTFRKVQSLLRENGYGIIVELYDVIAYQDNLLVDKELFG